MGDSNLGGNWVIEGVFPMLELLLQTDNTK